MAISSLSRTDVDDSATDVVQSAIGLYVHIPFCLSKCNYCDFNTYEGIEGLIPTFVDALSSEIAIWGRRLQRPAVSTIFFGGGTPSYLPAASVVRLLDCIGASMQIAADAEITLEANPDDVEPAKCIAWLDAGFNRISIGVQSLHDPILSALSRRHDSATATRSVRTARDEGFDNINIDLMFGMPNQQLYIWETTLRRAVALGTEHLSLYGLQIERGTPLHRDVQRGTVPEPDDDVAADMYELAMDVLCVAGYEHYEISNWAKPGHQSRHNMAYWLNTPYLGVGPGAHSSMMGKRFANMKSPRRYINTMAEASRSDKLDELTISEGESAIDFVEDTSRSMAMSETMMLGMRLAEGVSEIDFQKRFRESIESVYGSEIEYLESAGLIEKSGDRIRLTRRGRLLGNSVFEQFILTD